MIFVCFYLGKMKDRGEGFDLSHTTVFDHYNSSVFARPRPSSQPPKADLHLLLPHRHTFPCVPEQDGDPRSSWGAGAGSGELPVPGRKNFLYENSLCGASSPLYCTRARSHDPLGEPQALKRTKIAREQKLCPRRCGSGGVSSAAPP